jgi:hypothetical protein
MKPTHFFLLFILIILASCSTTAQYNDPVPEHETFTIDSKKLGETRTINVWTPPVYKESKDSFPILYMPDGGIINEDFPHIANTLAELIASKKIKPLILVGIANTERRRDLTGPTEVEKDKEIAPVVGGSQNFRDFIKDELFEEINNRYRTTNEKGIIGESLAGLFVTETFLLDPNMFDYYIAFDPSLWWNNKYLISTAKEDLSKFPTTPKRFWFAGSGLEDVSSTVGLLAKVLETKNLNNLKWKYSEEPKEKHSTIFRATKEKALIWTLNEK